ncbi:MAG: hypothetical protein A2X35_08625 [Elusimicrobia bacterium GWA2_61_42]|nr:MAG: hypothetical protein A2X35_08625 [Elusimicrobia bacterium GWA2_61_42]OGR77300.1 MAG: hypothetical protein A2X38_09175 [Elusimicrobia bacterium GWC2_61_25]
MDKTNPFAGLIACDSYKHLLAIFLFGTFCAVAASVTVNLTVNSLLGLSTLEIASFFNGSIFALLCAQVLKERGVDFAAAWRDWSAGAARDLRTALKYFGGYLLIIAAIVASVLLFIYLSGKPPEAVLASISAGDGKYEIAKAAVLASPWRAVFLFLSVCALGPLGEELFFRRLMYVSFRKKMAFLPALLVSSALFAATHLSAALLVFPVGLLLGYTYEKERRLPVNIFLHSMINIAVSLVRLS